MKRIAVLGAAAAAVLGGTLAIMPLSKVDAPMRASGPCGDGAGVECERVASVLMPEAANTAGTGGVGGTGAGGHAGTACTGGTGAGASGGTRVRPACAAPGAAQVPAPGGLGARSGVPSASVPGLAVPGVPGQAACRPWACREPAARRGQPGTRFFRVPARPRLTRRTGSSTASVAANTVNPIVSGVVGSWASSAAWARLSLNPLTTLVYLSRANGTSGTSDLTGAAKLGLDARHPRESLGAVQSPVGCRVFRRCVSRLVSPRFRRVSQRWVTPHSRLVCRHYRPLPALPPLPQLPPPPQPCRHCRRRPSCRLPPMLCASTARLLSGPAFAGRPAGHRARTQPCRRRDRRTAVVELARADLRMRGGHLAAGVLDAHPVGNKVLHLRHQ